MPKLNAEKDSSTAIDGDDLLKHYKLYLFLGCDLELDGDHATGDCPLCGREGKFFVKVAGKEDAKHFLGGWSCLKCGEKGNPLTFIRKFFALGIQRQTNLERFAKTAKLLDWQTCAAWGMTVLNGELFLPAYSAELKLINLYKRANNRWYSCPAVGGIKHGVWMAGYDPKKPNVYVNEGAGDGMAIWEVLKSTKRDGGKLSPTGSDSASLLGEVNVLAVPSATIFDESWAGLLGDKRGVLLYDNDHPKAHPKTGAIQEPVGWAGMKRVAEILSRAEVQPRELDYLDWSRNGSTHDPKRKAGFDVRDALTTYPDLKGRIEALRGLLGAIKPIPEDWVAGRSKEARKSGGVGIECLPCDNWRDLIMSWRKAMKWTPGLDRALSVMLAVSASTRALGSQLWAKIVGPPSCGKSTLCEALSINRKYVYPKDTLSGGLISAYQVDKEGSENLSMAGKLKDKTLIINDGDTLLKLPNRDQILSQLRAFYGRNLRHQAGNLMSADFEGINCTVLMCGTNSLRELDTSELGERFLDCVIMEGIDEELEDEINKRISYRAVTMMTMESNGEAESHHSEEMLRAYQLTGGYIDYLRENAKDLFAGIHIEEEALDRCRHLAKFVAYMRARPSKKQDESTEREFSGRLVEQHVRLAMCLAIVLNRSSVDEEVLARVCAVAKDTARGRTFDLVRLLYESGEGGKTLKALSVRTGHPEDAERKLVRFLKRIGVVEQFEDEKARGMTATQKWRLTPRLTNLYREVFEL